MSDPEVKLNEFDKDESVAEESAEAGSDKQSRNWRAGVLEGSARAGAEDESLTYLSGHSGCDGRTMG